MVLTAMSIVVEGVVVTKFWLMMSFTARAHLFEVLRFILQYDSTLLSTSKSYI